MLRWVRQAHQLRSTLTACSPQPCRFETRPFQHLTRLIPTHASPPRLVGRTSPQAGFTIACLRSASSDSVWSTGEDEEEWGPSGSDARLQWHRDDMHVVLVHPRIPQNTGNIARSCAATAVPLHLVKPLGFELDDKKLKRAGLDYWPKVCVNVHDSWQAFYSFFEDLPGPKRLVAFSVYGDTYYAGPEFRYQKGDWLIFGAETTGLPAEARMDIMDSGGRLVKIPIVHTHVRSLNLAVSAGIGLFEALRQLDEEHVVAPRSMVAPTGVEMDKVHKLS